MASVSTTTKFMFNFTYWSGFHGLAFATRMAISVLIAIGFDMKIPLLVRFSFILVVILLLAYFVLRSVIFYFVYLKEISCFFKDCSSIFFYSNYSKLEAKFVLAKCLLIVIALTALLFDLTFVDLNLIVIVLLVSIPICIVAMQSTYSLMSDFMFYNGFDRVSAFFTLWSCCLVPYYLFDFIYCVNNCKNNLNFDYHLWLLRVPMMCSVVGADLYMVTCVLDLSVCEQCCPVICYVCTFALWIFYEVGNAGVDLFSYVMIPLWLVWFFPLCLSLHSLFKCDNLFKLLVDDYKYWIQNVIKIYQTN